MDIPTTQPRLRTSPKDFFLHLLTMVTLYASAISLGTVLFQVINLWIPDPLEAAQQYSYMKEAARTTLRFSLSTLIIMFPAYVASVWYLNKAYAKDPQKRNLRVRKWLLYFTLFAATIIILVSLVSLINHLLNGELTVRFFLKLVSVVGISGAIFGYYFSNLKKYHTEEI